MTDMQRAFPGSIVELTISEARDLLASGSVSATEMTAAHLRRVAAYDRGGMALNSVVVLNPDLFKEAAESDRRLAMGGQHVRPLEGIPFTVKDSFKVRGLPVANGSPAFRDLIAAEDAFAVDALRRAGAILIGKTNMPPMAAGGMQRGLYGRSESPYNPDYLPAAYASGSSHGSGVSTAASFAVFGMAEETVSSGRSPASNNGLCAYTPSRGMISIRGNWPLFATCDVVVPQCRTMSDLLQVADVLLAEDPRTDGDFWREQEVVKLPRVSEVRVPDLREIASGECPRPLEGVRLGVPAAYLGTDPHYPVVIRPSVRELWEQARARLVKLGAQVVECEFPVITDYEGKYQTAEQLDRLGVLPNGWMRWEFGDLMRWGWDQFLRKNADVSLARTGEPSYPAELAQTNGAEIFPLPKGALPDRYDPVAAGSLTDSGMVNGDRHTDAPARAAAGLVGPAEMIGFAEGLLALEEMRSARFEAWLEEQSLDGLVFPANGDVARSDSDVVPSDAAHAWSNGVLYSNGNYVLRHLGIPTVTVPMGLMGDTGMPVGLTFAGPAYSDMRLLGWGCAAEASSLRISPKFTPPLPTDRFAASGERPVSRAARQLEFTLTVEPFAPANSPELRLVHLTGYSPTGTALTELLVTVNGQTVATEVTDDGWCGSALVQAKTPHGTWAGVPQILAVVTARSKDGDPYVGYREERG
ncbi:amidase [Leucobacter sp. W1153]|uniref:amidase n=1 Tax=Leucobacter sp. W1153 TaxID=3439064 RepID=UPI003F33CBD9